jgi:hypothetical protein
MESWNLRKEVARNVDKAVVKAACAGELLFEK